MSDPTPMTNGHGSPKITNGSPKWSVEAAIAKLPEIQQPAIDTPSPIPFFHMLERLKTTKREGWKRFPIRDPESIADHMYRMSLMTLFAPSTLVSRLNTTRCCQMALVHDMAESLVGDLTPRDGVAKAEKNRREATTMDYICTKLLGKVNGGLKAQEIRDLWQEYEDAETLESRFVHDVDKIEMVCQIVEYERSCGVDLKEFTWCVKMEEMGPWVQELVRERNVHRKERGWVMTDATGRVVDDAA